MQTLTEMVNASIDEMNYSEFQSVVSVCESLIENYEKAYTMNIYSSDGTRTEYGSFMECFIAESFEWRKMKEDGKRENILISILLLPVRLVQALIKLIKKSRMKSESESLDKKLDDIEELASEDRLKVASAVGKKEVTRKKLGESDEVGKTETTVTIDASNRNVEIESNVDLEALNTNVEVAKDEIKSETEKLNEVLERRDVGADLDRIVRHGGINKRQAKQLTKMLTSVTTNGKNRIPVKGYQTVKKKSINLFDEAERLCAEYQRAIEHLISVLKNNPTSDESIDDEVMRQLIELHKVSQTVVVSTAEGLAYLEANIAACNQAADLLLKGKDEDKEE